LGRKPDKLQNKNHVTMTVHNKIQNGVLPVAYKLNGCNVVILLSADNAFLFFKAKEVEL